MRKLLLILGLISLLGGCGGGGTDPIETPKLSLNPFLGAWYNIAPDTSCGDPSKNPPYYKEGPSVLSTEYYSDSFLYFSDVGCTNFIGNKKILYSIVWSAPNSLQTKDGAVRAQISNPKYLYGGQIPPPPTPEDPNITYKILFFFKGNRLQSYYGVLTQSPNLDNGYPLGNALPDIPSFEYEKTAPTN
jgi:hypothetical protein